MAIKFDTFKTSTAGASDVTSVNGEQGDVIVTLDSATDQGATTTNSITVGGLSVGTAYSLPTADGSSGQAIVSDGSGNLSFTTIDPTGGLEYKGTFNATAGTPSLANAEQGDYYKIDTEGTIYGKTWAVNDSLLINADMGGTITNSKIDKIDNTESVTSVNSQTGAVNLGAGDLSDVTITSAANGEVLKYNGAAWVDANVDYTEVTNTPTNVSTFTNDANYVASGDNVSVLTNDANYVASGDNVSVLTNDAGYLTDITGESIGDLSDVTVTSAANGEVLSYNGTNWVNSASSAGSLSGLSDVTITSAASGEVLKYNGTAWVDAQLAYSELSGTPTNVSTFTNDANYVASGDNVSTLTNDAGYLTSIPTASHSTAGILETATNAEATNATANDKIITPANLSHIDLSTFDNDSGFISDITSENIGDLSDVTITSAVNGEVLSYNGTNWVNSASSAGSLSGLSDVTITSASNGEVLKYNGTAWVDAQLAYSELSGTPTNVSTFTNDANYVASGDNVSVLTNDSGYITDITAESLNDLSDVSFTASSSIDNYVLTYDHSTTSWGAEASTASNTPLTSASPSSDYTISSTAGSERAYILTPSADINVNLPSASTAGSGFKYIIKNLSSAYTLTVDANSTETIDGTQTYDINVQYQSLTIISDGTNWLII